VSAVVLNVTVVAPVGAGFVTVFGDGSPRPGASNLNFVRGQTVPNLVVAPVGVSGKVDLYNGSAGSVQLVADVSGWFRSGAPPGPVTAVTATPGNTSVALAWVNPAASSLTGVMIRRALGPTPPASATAGILVADVAKPVAAFTDSGLASKTQYSYALFAHDARPTYAKAATVTSTTTGVVVPSIAGTVTDAGGTHHGLDMVRVDVVSTYTGNGVSTSTLADGTWSVIGLAAGTYSVCFDASDAEGGSSDATGYVNQCYKNQPTVQTSNPVTVTAGATRSAVDAALVGIVR